MEKLSEEARKLRNAYEMRRYREDPERARRIRARYWNKKALAKAEKELRDGACK